MQNIASASIPASATFHEPARSVSIVEHTDVIVAGGGPAGVAAAIGAARNGARVRLIEAQGCLGGIWTAGLLSWILDKDNKPGIMQEILQRLDALNARNLSNAYDTEAMKRVLEEMCAKSKVEVRLLTSIVAAAVDDRTNTIACILTESKSGREAWTAQTYIDCTGDGDLAARAQCGFDAGRNGTDLRDTGPFQGIVTQPVSLMCLITGVTFEDLNSRGICRGNGITSTMSKPVFMEELKRCGVHPSYTSPGLFPIRNDLFAVLINHEYGVSANNAQELTDATMHARIELHGIFDRMRAAGGIWKNVRLASTAERIGVREGRRIHGRYTVSQDDLREGRSHEDAVCRVTFGVDIHSTDPTKSKNYDSVGFRALPYDIPVRALIAKDINGLLMAGRCVSGDFVAHSSFRVTGNAVAMGEAAGRLAALACKAGVMPHEVPWTSPHQEELVHAT